MEERFENTRQPDWDWWGRVWPTPGETLRGLGLSEGDDVAEIGSGNGYFALPAARIVEPGTVYAVDIDEALLGELETLAAMKGVGNIETVTADARRLSEEVPAVDVALLLNSLHGVEDPGTLVREVAETLADGGRFVVVNWRDLPRSETTVAGEERGPPENLRMTPDETVEAVADGTPLRETGHTDVPPYHYAVVFEKE